MKDKNNDGQFKIKICKEDFEFFNSLFEDKKENKKNEGSSSKKNTSNIGASQKKLKPKGYII
jgi:hypothetical protein